MKTKYENFLEHLIHGIDEPKKTFGKYHNIIGFESDKFRLKGNLLSATKIFLSDDFIYKQFLKFAQKSKHPKGIFLLENSDKLLEDVKEYHNKLFIESLPPYDNLLMIFPYFLNNKYTNFEKKEFMAGCWIRKTIPSKDFGGIPRNFIHNEDYIYQIATFDNACKLAGYPERINLSLVDYMVDFQGGIGRVRPQFESGQTELQHRLFGQFREEVQKSFMTFIDILPSFIQKKKLDLANMEKVFSEVSAPTSQLNIFVYLNLLNFINQKGSETIAFKSSLPIKKRSNVIKGFEYKMLEVKKANRITTRYGDSINKNRLHQVRGHIRHYQSGKRTWIKAHQRGDEKMGVIVKDYNFK